MRLRKIFYFIYWIFLVVAVFVSAFSPEKCSHVAAVNSCLTSGGPLCLAMPYYPEDVLQNFVSKKELELNDAFYYKIPVFYSGPLPMEIYVTVVSPSGEILDNNSYTLNTTSSVLEPRLIGDTFSAFQIQESGVYKIILNGNSALYFIKLDNTTCGYYSGYGQILYSFDVLSSWERNFRKAIREASDTSVAAANESSNTLKQVANILENVKSINEQMLTSTRNVESLTIVVIILTLFNVLVVWILERRRRRGYE
ncbi:Uncharacterised protein [Candidatus Norongarragalina meridionalis]|nr:Uncharacterised protein [Candidatus Norongarragalina meridionalis]